MTDSAAAVARLQEVSRKVAAGGDLYQDILDAAVELVGSDAGSIQVVDEERHGLRLVASRGFHPTSAEFWGFVETGSQATCGTALATGKRVVVSDVEAVPSFVGSQDLREWRRSGIRAVQSTPLVSRDGRLVGMLSTHWRAPHEPLDAELRLVDVLARQAADLLDGAQVRVELESSRALLDEALATARMATWVWDPERDRLDGSASLADVLGLREGETLVSGTRAFELVHPDDRARRRDVLERARSGGGSWHHEFRIVRPRDGSVAWLEERGAAARDPASGEARLSGLLWDVTEARDAEAERDRREQREREFVANAAHELRTPVANIVSGIAALEAGAQDEPAERERFFTHLRREADRLTRLTDSLLALARADAREDVPRAAVAIRPLLEEIAAGLDLCPGTTVEVVAAGELTVDTNRELLERVLASLAANAAAQTEQGAITLSATAAEESVLLDVRDGGAGIDPATVERAFDRFYRGRGTQTTGFGLGLAIARQAAAVLGAEIALARHPDGGSVAHVVLPRQRV